MSTTLKTVLKITIPTILIIIVVGITAYVLTMREPGLEQIASNVSFPISTSTTADQNSNLLPIILNDGSTSFVRDFTQDEQPIWVSDSESQVGGSPYEDFLITYINPSSTNPQGIFFVTILAEPLGETRKLAEASLASSLGLPLEKLCLVRADVAAGPGLSSIYGPSINLGFSMCQGSVQLP